MIEIYFQQFNNKPQEAHALFRSDTSPFEDLMKLSFIDMKIKVSECSAISCFDRMMRENFVRNIKRMPMLTTLPDFSYVTTPY